MDKPRVIKPKIGAPDEKQVQMQNLHGAHGCCQVAIEIVGSQKPELKDLQRYQNALGWLQGVQNNIVGEIMALQQVDAPKENAPGPEGEAKDVAPAQAPESN